MDEVDINITRVSSLVNEFRQNELKTPISDKFTKVAKNLLESYYSIRKDPQASIYRRRVADTIFSQKFFPGLIANALATCLKEIQLTSKMFDDQTTTLEAFKAAAFLQAAILNFSDCSSKFSKALLENKKYIQCNKVILENVAVERLLLTPDKSILYFLKCTLNCAYNLLKYRGDEARVIFNEANYISLIQRYTTSTAVDVKSSSSIILTYLVNEEEIPNLISDEIIIYILTTLKSAFTDGPTRSTGFDTVELCLCLEELVKNDAVCKRVLKHGALPLLKHIFANGTQKQRCAACCVLLVLSFNREAKQAMKSDCGLIFSRDLQTMNKSRKKSRTDNGLFDCIALKSWLLENPAVSAEEHDERSTEWMRNILQSLSWELAVDERINDAINIGKVLTLSKPHLMISYKHADKGIAKTISSAAKSAGFEVWIDTEKLQYEDGILEGMAKAVENCFAVCILYSEEYKRSPNTRAEAEYAYSLNKPMIFCRTRRNYIPDGWLGLLYAGKMHVDFSGKRPIATAEQQLVEVLKKHWNKFDGLERNASSSKVDEGKNTLRIPAWDSNVPNRVSDEGTAHEVGDLQELMATEDPHKVVKKPIAGTSSLEADTSEWSNIQVQEWMVEKKISMLADKKEPLVGEDLLFLKKLQKDAPAFFFKLITKHWRVKSIQDIRAISMALEEL